MKLTLLTPELELRRVPAAQRRGGGAAAPFPTQFLAEGVTVADQATITVPPQRRAGPLPLAFRAEAGPGEGCVLAVRHASGALTFHAGRPVAVKGRRSAQAATVVEFQVELPEPDEALPAAKAARRGGVVQTVLLKVAGAAADLLLPKAVAAFEEARWKKHGLTEGWLRVTPATLSAGKLVPALPTGSAGRGLLLLHGTFSHAANAFGDLAAGDFFPRLQPLYGDRIFAFNHFTLSKTPEENVRDLLASLPEGVNEFDVITHSRGGLVLRQLVERSATFGALGRRFRLGHAVLVAAPNEGTPLATPARWDQAVSWFANLCELLQAGGTGGPVATLGFAGEWVAEGIRWLASRVSGGIPGLTSMDMEADAVRRLQEPPGPPAGAYSALVANFQPDDAWWQRLLDAGVDRFFGGANDLVVPTEGGWRVDGGGDAIIAPARIGCFGPGGNLAASAGPVMHTNFFRQAATVDFLVRALERQGQGVAPVATTTRLGARRRGGRVTADPSGVTKPVPSVELLTPKPEPPALEREVATPLSGAPAPAIPVELADEAPVPDEFHLLLLGARSNSSGAFKKRVRKGKKPAAEPEDDNGDGGAEFTLLAIYGGARVIVPFYASGDQAGAGARMQELIATQRRLRGYIDGATDQHGKAYSLPTDQELREFGTLLFETLFPGDVRRLYDVARSRLQGRSLSVIFTSAIPWLADFPWEFAHDPATGTFLATEDVHFLRNVVTFTPGDINHARRGPLRVLVVAAQPVGTGQLSLDEEIAQLRFGFEGLMEAGLLTVEILPRATLETFHGRLSTGRYDILHFIGHGEFDPQRGGRLLFEGDGRSAREADEQVLRKLISGRGLRLVFLNACETGRGGRGKVDFNRGVAPSLLAHGVPAVVANQFKVLDASATEFAQRFYWSLANGLTLGQAAREARIAVDYSLTGEAIDWAVPVVYALDPNVRLSRGAAAAAQPFAAFRGAAARRAARRPLTVGVWDVEGAFPGLRPLLDQLMHVQDVFGFEQVSVTAPLGTWRRRQDEQGQSSLQLDVCEVARRLDAKARELGVDYLVCLTRYWLVWQDKAGQEFREFVWWPDTEERKTISERVVLFSAALFGGDLRGAQSRRMVVNGLVTGLAGAIYGRQSHSEGADTCPLSWHVGRRIHDQLSFEPACRQDLQEALAASGQPMAAVEALEQLLAAPV